MKKVLLAVLVAGAACLSASAASIYEIGTVVPGSPASADWDQFYLTQLISGYNSHLTSPFDIPVTDGHGPWTGNIDAGSSVPSTLSGLDGSHLEGSMTGISGNESVTLDLDGLDFDYLTIKWGNGFEAYYIAGLSGSTIFENNLNNPNNDNNNGISGYTFWNGSSVPDGGSTLALLGMGLSGLAWLGWNRKKA